MSNFEFGNRKVWPFVAILLVMCLTVGGLSGYAGYKYGVGTATSMQAEAEEEGVVEVDPMWFVSDELDVTSYSHLHDDVVFDYSDLLEGESIVTVAIVDYTMPGKLYAQTSIGSGSIGFEFDNKKVPVEVNPGDVITVAGVMSTDRRHGVTMKHCQIIGFGEISGDLKSSSETQRVKFEELRELALRESESETGSAT